MASPIGVPLPRHGPLKQILVSEGEVVRQGQTLALLDEVALEVRQSQVADRLVELRLLRECLRPKADADFLAGLPAILSGVDAERRTQLSFVEEDCALRDAAAQALQASAAARVAALEERSVLLTTKIAVLVEQQNSGGQGRQDRAVEAVETLLEKNRVDADLADARRDLSEQELARGIRRHEEADAHTQEISVLLDEAQRLAGLISQPRLMAPVNGVVTRVRDPGQGHVAISDIRIFEIARAGSQRFSLAISVPAAEIARLEDGARVDVRLVGQPSVAPLGGAIDLDRVPLAPPGRDGSAADAAIMVNLDAASRTRLGRGIATARLGGSSTASDVRVTLGEARFADLLIDGLTEAFPTVFDEAEAPTVSRVEEFGQGVSGTKERSPLPWFGRAGLVILAPSSGPAD
ncbi:MAG: biotin/lipoyl-binding protein [Pseudomonadota bacterium]